MTPTADGGAYATTLDAGVWYLRGPEAVRVKFGSKADTEIALAIWDLIPTADGGAYAESLGGGELWYLREDVAVLVQESSALSAPVVDREEDRFFALYVDELRRRRTAEQDAQESNMGPDEYYGPEY